MGTLITPERMVHRFRDLVTLRNWSRSHPGSYDEFQEQAVLGQLLTHFYELKPVRVKELMSLIDAYDAWQENHQDEQRRVAVVQSIFDALQTTKAPDNHAVRDILFSFAPPEHAFVTSNSLRTFFLNLNESLCTKDSCRKIVQEYAHAIHEIRSEQKIHRLAFVQKRFGPVGPIELLVSLSNATGLPTVTYQPYVQHVSDHPTVGKIKKGERLCLVYDVGITGRLITDFTSHVRNIHSADVAAAVVFLDFNEGAADAVLSKGVTYRPLHTKRELLEDIAGAYEKTYKTKFQEHITR